MIFAMEKWKVIDDHPDYYVSDKGRVKSLKHKKEHVLKNRKTSGGHVSVSLYSNGTPVTYRVHRLVAEAFVDNPNGDPIVRHINGMADDNRAENLCWGTQKDNVWDSIRSGTHVFNRRPMDRYVLDKYLEKHRTPVIATNISTNEERWYGSQLEAAQDLGVLCSSLNSVLKNRRHSTKGWTFRYAKKGD